MTAIASFPTIVGAYWRLRNGEEPVPVRSDLPHAAHYLHQLFGAEPSAERARALETYLNTVCDHGLNASTFAARVIVSTRSDVISAITGAVGALKGPLHGGAPGPALDMVFEIGTPERAEAVIRARLDRGERLMGFGHRVYRVRDPRADVLAQAAERFYASDGDRSLYDLARKVEATALRLLRERKPDRRLDTNVEFYTALLLHGLGLPTRIVHADLCGRTCPRLGGALPGTAPRRQADQAAIGLYRPDGPSLRSRRSRLNRGSRQGCRVHIVSAVAILIWPSRSPRNGHRADAFSDPSAICTASSTILLPSASSLTTSTLMLGVKTP